MDFPSSFLPPPPPPSIVHPALLLNDILDWAYNLHTYIVDDDDAFIAVLTSFHCTTNFYSTVAFDVRLQITDCDYGGETAADLRTSFSVSSHKFDPEKLTSEQQINNCHGQVGPPIRSIFHITYQGVINFNFLPSDRQDNYSSQYVKWHFVHSYNSCQIGPVLIKLCDCEVINI